MVEHRVGPEHAGERLDRFLTRALELSRTQVQKHIEAGAIKVDGEIPRRGAKTQVRVDNVIHFEPPAAVPLDLIAEDIPVPFLYQDEHLVVVDKPAGLVVHPAVGHPNGTLLNALLFHIPEFERATDELRPGIVHRLDRGTTGAMVVAKTRVTHQRLVEMFKARDVDKRYFAVTKGVPRPLEDTIETLFGRHPRDRKRFSARVEEGKTAVTHYETDEIFVASAAVRIALETGRTHQIRVHFADRGMPLIGDPVYGARRRSKDPRLAPLFSGFGRPALHAQHLGFDHPITGAPMAFEAPVPDDLCGLLDALRKITEDARGGLAR